MSVSEGDRKFRRIRPIGLMYMAMLFILIAWGMAYGVETADSNQKDDSQRDVESEAETSTGPVEIQTGFVIGEKGYISPPYLVRSIEEVVHVNQQAVLVWFRRGGFRRPSGNEDDRSRGDRPGGPPRGFPMGHHVARIEQHLRNDGMIICVQGAPPAMITLRQALNVLDILINRRDPEAKIQDLMDLKVAWMASEQWGTVVENFKASEELLLRLQKARERCAQEDKERVQADHRFLRLHSVVTILGFLLAVWAFGSLFACRSPIPEGVSSHESSGVSPGQVIRLIVLIAILSTYDLVCTLFADGLGGLWELNPLAGSLLSSRASIVTFKLVLTAGACTLLVYARHHRLAQQAAWWSGVLYTMLILRWATFNSVFMPG